MYQHLCVLEGDGQVTSAGGGKSRGWRLTSPGLAPSTPGTPAAALAARTNRGTSIHPGSTSPARREETAEIPIVGRIAAGHPMESLQQDLPPLPFAPREFAASGMVVALEVEGDSMIEAGILPGDFAIIRRQPRVECGEIAAVTVDGEGTLKRWHQRGQRITLMPANRRFAPITGRRGLEVFGKLVGVVRLYANRRAAGAKP